MATVDFTLTPEQGSPLIGSGECYTFSWTLTDGDADGAPIRIGANIVDITFQASGAFDGATLTIEGANDGANWLTHVDMDGADMAYTAAPTDLKSPRVLGREIRPNTVGGGASQSIVVTASVRVAGV